MAEDLIQTLQANAGKNSGETIASHGRCIVFLPKECEPGKEYRLKLLELREDSRGRMMYRAVPAPVEYSERWKDNGDGTASRVTISTSWLLQESEEGELETRPLETREAPGQATIRADRVVEWGADLASSVVLEEQVKIIPTLAEKITPQGTITMKKVGEREEKGQIVSFPLTRISLYDCWWKSGQFQVKYEDSWSIQFGAYYQNKAGETWINVSSDWGSMPGWWKKEQEARFPVCSCGRQRRDPQVSDGYAKCELCRAEEKCVRCGKQADSKAVQIAGKIVCDTCRPLVEQEGLVASLLSDAHKQMIAEEARRLLAGKALDREAGLAVLEATMDLETGHNRLRILQEWSSAENPTGGNRIDRLWYYFGGDATYGSLYSPSVLQIFEFFPQASGNALIELVSWIANGNFYLSTQVSGRNIPSRLDEEEMRRVIEKLNAGKPVLADRLTGTEKNFQAEMSQLREKWDMTAGQGNPEGWYSGKAHHLESYVKEFIRLQYGVEYRNLGNAMWRHSVFSECEKVVTGNWEALRQARLTEPAISWLKDHEYLWDKDKVLKAFRAEPDFAEISPLFVEAERRAWRARREQDFWARLAAGAGKGGRAIAAPVPSVEEAGDGAAVADESGPSAMALAFAAAQKRR